MAISRSSSRNSASRAAGNTPIGRGAGGTTEGTTRRSRAGSTHSQMKAMHGAGMAGGILFSWFDEWFKKNWIFQPYALPAERKPFWFNLQDPEQNYGLVAAYPGYPGKKVTLSGNMSEWEEAAILYEKKAEAPGSVSTDGGDDARTLTWDADAARRGIPVSSAGDEGGRSISTRPITSSASIPPRRIRGVPAALRCAGREVPSDCISWSIWPA